MRGPACVDSWACVRAPIATTGGSAPTHASARLSLPIFPRPVTRTPTASSGRRSGPASSGRRSGQNAPTVVVRAAPGGLDDATLTFPENAWEAQKAEPKLSLRELPTDQSKSARAWKLNLIELVHWASFPLGFWVAHFIFVHYEAILPHVGGDMSRLFCLVLGLLCQVFGGGISGNMMHAYEGWQVAPFRNILGLPPQPGTPEVDQIRVNNYNNAWLRAVAYQMLFTFQTLGLGLFTLGVYGMQAWAVALVGVSTFVAIYGPHHPRTNFTVKIDGNPQPILPLSWSLLVVFAINVVFNLSANHTLFAPSIVAAWPPTVLPWLKVIPASVVQWVPLLAPLTVAAGGAIEGGIAESTFNQWWHFTAFVILLLGLGLTGLMYWPLVFPSRTQ